MFKFIFIICFVCLFITYACSPSTHHDAQKKSIKHGKSLVPYFRFDNSDGVLIISTEIANCIDTITNSNGDIVDSLLSPHNEEVLAYFPRKSMPSILNGAGNIFFNKQKVYEDRDSSYMLQNLLNDFKLDTVSTFKSNWVVKGADSIMGFDDSYSNNNFPSSFHFQIDTEIHVKNGYNISLDVGSGLKHADSLVYTIYSLLHSEMSATKVVSAKITKMKFTPQDLSVFVPGTVATIAVMACNYRLSLKNDSQNIYFINRRTVSNVYMMIKP